MAASTHTVVLALTYTSPPHTLVVVRAPQSRCHSRSTAGLLLSPIHLSSLAAIRVHRRSPLTPLSFHSPLSPVTRIRRVWRSRVTSAPPLRQPFSLSRLSLPTRALWRCPSLSPLSQVKASKHGRRPVARLSKHGRRDGERRPPKVASGPFAVIVLICSSRATSVFTPSSLSHT